MFNLQNIYFSLAPGRGGGGVADTHNTWIRLWIQLIEGYIIILVNSNDIARISKDRDDMHSVFAKGWTIGYTGGGVFVFKVCSADAAQKVCFPHI